MTEVLDTIILIEETKGGQYLARKVGQRLGEEFGTMAHALKALVDAGVLHTRLLSRLNGFVFVKVAEKTSVAATELVGLLAYMRELIEWDE